LNALGQSPWLDFISRSGLRGGQIAALLDQGIVGVTSNPAIFEAAIVGSSDYDEDIKTLSAKGLDAFGIYDELSRGDVVEAAGLLRPIYDRTHGLDGYVSLEVSPLLASDTEGTIAEGRRLWAEMGQPNVMIKVPATREGIPAVRALVADGIPVNVTLLFSIDRYLDAAEAYIQGLEDRAATGKSLAVASVASFFVSRMDTLLDPTLPEELRGKAAIALSQAAYARWKELFGSERFSVLRDQGAAAQRLLWASTSTKNPAYRPTIYVETLVGPETVNTLPLATIQAVLEMDQVGTALPDAIPAAMETIKVLEAAGVDFAQAAQTLEEEGVDKFVKPFHKLLESVESKRALVTA
jgi:transaldolase